MFTKLKQFKDMRDKAKQLQSALATEVVEGSGAWGKVKVTMDANMAVSAVAVSEELLAASGKGKLEAAVKDAINDAVKKAQRKMVEKMRSSGDFKVPGLS